MITIFEKTYEGCEDAIDVFRDVGECFDGRFNPVMKQIPGEFQGTMRVTITYEPSEDDPPVKADPA